MKKKKNVILLIGGLAAIIVVLFMAYFHQKALRENRRHDRYRYSRFEETDKEAGRLCDYFSKEPICLAWAKQMSCDTEECLDDPEFSSADIVNFFVAPDANVEPEEYAEYEYYGIGLSKLMSVKPKAKKVANLSPQAQAWAGKVSKDHVIGMAKAIHAILINNEKVGKDFWELLLTSKLIAEMPVEDQASADLSEGVTAGLFNSLLDALLSYPQAVREKNAETCAKYEGEKLIPIRCFLKMDISDAGVDAGDDN